MNSPRSSIILAMALLVAMVAAVFYLNGSASQELEEGAAALRLGGGEAGEAKEGVAGGAALTKREKRLAAGQVQGSEGDQSRGDPQGLAPSAEEADGSKQTLEGGGASSRPGGKKQKLSLAEDPEITLILDPLMADMEADFGHLARITPEAYKDVLAKHRSREINLPMKILAKASALGEEQGPEVGQALLQAYNARLAAYKEEADRNAQ